MSNRNKVLSNMAWRFAERVGAQGVKLLVEIILARLLLPDDFGQIALVAVFITILNVFVDSGLGNALIQKKDADDLDFSSVFWFNIAWCIVLYIILSVAAPFIASFYHRSELTPIIRVLGLQVIVSGIKNVQQAYVSKTLQFRKFFFATLTGTIGAAVIGILMAYRGMGVWAIVAQQLFNVSVDTIMLWIIVKWKPKFAFSFKRLKGLLSFGWKLLLSSLINTFYTEVRQLIIGKYYSSDSLAFYNRGQQFPHLFVTNINNTIDSVLFPTMSKAQDDVEHLKSMVKRSLKTSVFIMAPLMIGLAFVAEPFVKLILTEKWLPCVPFLRVFCITFMFYPLHTANLNAIKAMGRSDLYLKLEIVKKTLGFVLLFTSMWFGVMAMAYSLLLESVISQIINSWPNKKLLKYSYLDQLKDIMPSIVIALITGIIVFFLQYLNIPDVIILVMQITIGGFIYILLSKILHIDSFEYLVNTVKGLLHKQKKEV